MTPAQRQRLLRRRHQHERQAVIFGAVLAAMAVAALASAAVLTGALDAPFSRAFTTVKPSGAAVAPVPCPPTGALPVAYSKVTVNVYNGTSQVGLAGKTAAALQAREFRIGTVGDSPTRFPGTAKILFGKAGLAQAYTLAAHLPDPTLVYDARTGKDVDVVVGARYPDLVATKEVGLSPKKPLRAPAGCVPVTRATPAPAPTPTAKATATATPKG